MTFKSSLTIVRYYTAADPYYYTVDNRPLSDLATREDAIADELDRRTIAIDITGASSPILTKVPTGWTVTRNAAGDYLITHNFNSSNYIVTGNTVGAAGIVYLAPAPGINSFNVRTANMSGTLIDIRFNLLVTGY